MFIVAEWKNRGVLQNGPAPFQCSRQCYTDEFLKIMVPIIIRTKML